MGSYSFSNIQKDILAGFVVFLIAMPLSLGIAMASGVPPMAGLLSAIVGGLFVSLLSGSAVTINGPAAGLIVVVLQGVEILGSTDGAMDPMRGYQGLLVAVIVSGALLMLLASLGAAKLADVFPLSAVHGMLSAIGIMIIVKQLHVGLGVSPTAKSPFGLMAELPHSVMSMNPEIAAIAAVCVAIMLLLPRFTSRVPAPLVAVFAGIGLGYLFDLEHEHLYLLPFGHEFTVGPKFLVTLPESVSDALAFPDFATWSQWFQMGSFWTVTLTLCLVQGLETLLSAAAVDKLDPLRRTSNLKRDLMAVGAGSVVSGGLGGLPMIAEIVRSTANIANGAKTKWANFSHGFFMLVFLLLLRDQIHHIPLAALSAILIVTGYKLASPSQFAHALHIGREQLVIFVATLLLTLGTDLIIGIIGGMFIKILLHWMRGADFRDLFRPNVVVTKNADGVVLVQWTGAAAFTNVIKLRSILKNLNGVREVRLNFTHSLLIDHTALERLQDISREFQQKGVVIVLEGLEEKVSEGDHPLSVRRAVNLFRQGGRA